MGTVGGLLLLSPVLAADLMFMMPTAAMIALAGGTIFREAGQIPRCRACQFPMDGTPNPYDDPEPEEAGSELTPPGEGTDARLEDHPESVDRPRKGPHRQVPTPF